MAKLFTADIDKKLFEQYKFGGDLSKQEVVAKIFNPYGSGTWYLLNSDPQDPDYIWAIVDMFDVEIGSVSRNDLETMKVPPFQLHLERDKFFQPMNAQILYLRLRGGEKFEEGGEVIDRISEMVKHWNKYGWASSNINNDDSEFFKRIGKSYIDTATTSFTGNDINYYDADRVEVAGGSFKQKFATGGTTDCGCHKMEEGGSMDYKNKLGLVKVKFKNPKYNYSTNVSANTTEKDARKYFVGQMFNVGSYPREIMREVVDIEFYDKGTYAEGGEISEDKLWGWVKTIDDENLLSWCGFSSKKEFEDSTDTNYSKRNLFESNYDDLLYAYENKSEYGFSKGGEIANSNNEMLQSQLKAVEHHAKELSSIVTDKTPVEAWVVGKIERASTDLSDITHYLDGAKFEYGGELIDVSHLEDWELKNKLNTLTKEKEIGNYDEKTNQLAVSIMHEINKRQGEQLNKSYASGGSIKNQYAGKTAEQVWNLWNVEQKRHFLIDHYLLDMGKDLKQKAFYKKEDFINEYKNHSWEGLPESIKDKVQLHIFQGQYAKGGTIETDTPILVSMVAENVARYKYFEKNNVPKQNEPQLIKKADETIAKLEKHLEQKANTVYKNNEMFKKQLNQKGNKGRDALYMYMEHWADAFLGKGYAKGGGIPEIDMDGIEKSAKFYTDKSRWSVPPTISKFENEITEYKELRRKLDNKEITPSKIIGTGFKPNYARPLAYKWIDERILIAKRAIELLKESGETYAMGGNIKNKFRAYVTLNADEYGHTDGENLKPTKFYLSVQQGGTYLWKYENRLLDNYTIFKNDEDLKKAIDKVRRGYPTYELTANKFHKEFLPQSELFEYAKGGTMANGGILPKSEFTIQEIKEHLLNEFPDSFSFALYPLKRDTKHTPDYDAVKSYKGLMDSEIKGKLKFPQYKPTHSINYGISQGGENTYFEFLLETKEDYYVGTFGFKDEGDVPANYITKFLSFLQKSYGLPFEIVHEVMAKGGVTYNTGRSWHQDRARHNKAESWEIPLSQRKMAMGGELEYSYFEVTHYPSNSEPYVTYEKQWVGNTKPNNSKEITKEDYEHFIKYGQGGEVKDLAVGVKLGLLNPRNGRYKYSTIEKIQGDKVFLVEKHPTRSQWDNHWETTKDKIERFLKEDNEDFKDRKSYVLKFEQGGEIMSKGGKINKKYAYFALATSDNKIVNAWEIVDDVESLKYYAKEDMKDMDFKPYDYKLLSKAALIRQGIDPFNVDSWRKNEYADGGEVFGRYSLSDIRTQIQAAKANGNKGNFKWTSDDGKTLKMFDANIDWNKDTKEDKFPYIKVTYSNEDKTVSKIYTSTQLIELRDDLNNFQKEDDYIYKLEKGGEVKFKDKVKAVKASLLKTKKVSPKVQKDYGKTYSPKEAEQAAKRIVGSRTAKWNERISKNK